MLWIKAFHIIFMVTWFAGLFYLPRLFVYHAMSNDASQKNNASDGASHDRFVVMERKLLYGITTPGGILTLVSGTWLWLGYGFSGTWLSIKLALVAVLIVYHILCMRHTSAFKHRRNQHSHVYFRFFNEFPVLILVAIVILVVVKPW